MPATTVLAHAYMRRDGILGSAVAADIFPALALAEVQMALQDAARLR